ncbi:MAG: hypothetical protein JO353_10280 [Phycisphaerae bacterium]|nr:hypothetical protein [Phycisphaerae bacterium]
MIDALNELLDAELNSAFAFLEKSTPYLDRTHASLHHALHKMAANSQRRAKRLIDLIESEGASPMVRGLQPSEQFISYLSIQYLLPTLIEAKQRDIQRYQQAREKMRGPIAVLLDDMIVEQLVELEDLKSSESRSTNRHE